MRLLAVLRALAPALALCRYSGVDPARNGSATCEHVPFHLCLRRSRGLRIGIDPRLVNVRGSRRVQTCGADGVKWTASRDPKAPAWGSKGSGVVRYHLWRNGTMEVHREGTVHMRRPRTQQGHSE